MGKFTPLSVGAQKNATNGSLPPTFSRLLLAAPLLLLLLLPLPDTKVVSFK